MKRQRPEEALQRAVVRLWRAIGRPTVQMQADASGMVTGAIQRKIAAGMGTRAGWPDLVWINERGQVHFMELKSETGRLTDAQIEFEAWCHARRIPHIVCRSLDEAEAFWRIHGLSRVQAKVAA